MSNDYYSMGKYSNRDAKITTAQWSQFKTLFRNQWWQWSEEKRREELAVWMIRANHLVSDRKT